MGGVGLPVAGLLLLRRRRGTPSVVTGSVTESVIAPTTTLAAPAGEMDIIQDVIKKNPDGLTRAQIAQSLEISTSKATAMVKKLLASDSGFEEINEGRLRRIRFRGEE